MNWSNGGKSGERVNPYDETTSLKYQKLCVRLLLILLSCGSIKVEICSNLFSIHSFSHSKSGALRIQLSLLMWQLLSFLFGSLLPVRFGNLNLHMLAISLLKTTFILYILLYHNSKISVSKLISTSAITSMLLIFFLLHSFYTVWPAVLHTSSELSPMLNTFSNH